MGGCFEGESVAETEKKSELQPKQTPLEVEEEVKEEPLFNDKTANDFVTWDVDSVQWKYEYYNSDIFGAKVTKCVIVEKRTGKFFRIHLEEWENRWDVWTAMDDSKWINKPTNETVVGSKLERTNRGETLTVTILDIFEGEMLRLAFNFAKGDSDSDIWVMPNDNKLKNAGYFFDSQKEAMGFITPKEKEQEKGKPKPKQAEVKSSIVPKRAWNGRYIVVDQWPDFKVQIVTSWPDFKVKKVDRVSKVGYKDRPGYWEEVNQTSQADFKIQWVTQSNETQFKIQWVTQDHEVGLLK